MATKAPNFITPTGYMYSYFCSCYETCYIFVTHILVGYVFNKEIESLPAWDNENLGKVM